ncbi:hypothetical protein ACRAWD_02525 [Caulobacter segnis]
MPTPANSAIKRPPIRNDQMPGGPWNSDGKPHPVYRLMRIIGLALVVVGMWQLIQGVLAAQNPGAVAPAASWAVPAILGGIPIGTVLLVIANLRMNKRGN